LRPADSDSGAAGRDRAVLEGPRRRPSSWPTRNDSEGDAAPPTSAEDPHSLTSGRRAVGPSEGGGTGAEPSRRLGVRRRTPPSVARAGCGERQDSRALPPELGARATPPGQGAAADAEQPVTAVSYPYGPYPPTQTGELSRSASFWPLQLSGPQSGRAGARTRAHGPV
jgi:hypothetical protein